MNAFKELGEESMVKAEEYFVEQFVGWVHQHPYHSRLTVKAGTETERRRSDAEQQELAEADQ